MKKQLLKKPVLLTLLLLLLVCLPVTAEAAAKKAKYTIKKYEASYKGPHATGKYYFEMPKVKGSSKAVKKINKSLKAIYKASLTNKARLKQYTENETSSYYGKNKYYYTTYCEATYNDKGIVCFCFTDDWYAGGVHNMFHYGATYNLKTGKKLYLNNVVSGSKSKIRNKIVNAYVKALGYTRSADTIRSSLSYTKFKNFNFWLEDGNVKVNNGSYAPGGGNGELAVTLKGNYR